MKLEVGMYVRTKKGIRKIIKIDEDNNYYIDKPYINDFRQEIDCITNSCIICEPSHNIIDLIEEGDYVNGYKIGTLFKKSVATTDDCFKPLEQIFFYEKDIKSIVTKEQMASMSYKVGD